MLTLIVMMSICFLLYNKLIRQDIAIDFLATSLWIVVIMDAIIMTSML